MKKLLLGILMLVISTSCFASDVPWWLQTGHYQYSLMHGFILPIIAILAGAFPLPLIKNNKSAAYTVTAIILIVSWYAAPTGNVFISICHALGLIVGVIYKIHFIRQARRQQSVNAIR